MHPEWARRLRLGAVAFVLAFGFGAQAASAITIDFESPGASSTKLNATNQPYDTMGIDFVEGYTQDVAAPASLDSVPTCAPYLYDAGSRAHSGTQVLADGCPDGDNLSEPAGWIARLQNSASHVSLFAGGEAGLTVQLTGYDFSGIPIPGATESAMIGSDVKTPLAISSGAPNIFFISVQITDTPAARTAPPLLVDDLTFNNPGGGTPEILLSVPGASSGSVCADGFQGATTSCPVDIERFNGAGNALTLSKSALPSWLKLTGGLAVPAGANSSILTFSVGSGAPPHGIASFNLSAAASGSPSVTVVPVTMAIGVAADFYLTADYSYGDHVDLVAGAGAQSLVADLVTTGTPPGGTIRFSASGLPAGVSAKFTPRKTSDAAGQSTVTIAFKALPTAPPVTNVKATITGKMSGSSPERMTVYVTVFTFDLRAQAIELTQGVQYAYSQLGGIPSPTTASSSAYFPALGVDLVANKRTVVRFFADAYGAPQGVPGVSATLTGYRGSKLLGTLFPDYGSPKVLPDTGEPYPAPASSAELLSDANAFTFTLPASWTAPNQDVPIKLIAKVIPPPQVPSLTGAPSSYTQDCGGSTPSPKPSCPDSTYILTSVFFPPTGPALSVTPIELTSNGQSPGTIAQVFADVQAATPLADGSGLVVLPYAYVQNISSIIDTFGTPIPTPCKLPVNVNLCNSDASTINGNALTQVQNWESSSGATNVVGVSTSTSTYGVTVVPSGGPVGPLSTFNGAYDNPTTGGPSVVDYGVGATPWRPVTSVMHELFHQFGLVHASNCNGGGSNGQVAESWPPDQQGLLNGLDLNVTQEPYQVVANNAPNLLVPGKTFGQAFDVMSYCASIGAGDPNDWVSPRNWEALYSEFAIPPLGVPPARDAGGSASRALKRAPSRLPLALATLHPGVLHVVGVEDPFGLRITSVGPEVGPPLAQGSSPYGLIARGAHGQTLARVAMHEAGGHVDGTGGVILLQGEVPAAGVNSVEITSPDGRTATAQRPLTPPAVRVLGPTSGATVGGARAVTVRWAATEPGSASLTVQIDYSRDGGLSWRAIYGGPNAGRVTLPSFFFAASRNARVRVRVSDGFNETVAVSPRFVALDPPPQVEILSPAAVGHRIAASLDGDAVLQLRGVAFDAGLNPLHGASLRWYDNGVSLGAGGSLLTGPLPPGLNRITLLARDGARQVAKATAVVFVRPLTLQFLRLRIPHRIAASAQTLRIVAFCTLRATLTINGHRFALRARRRRPLVVGVPPGGTPVVLHLAITVDGITIPFAARVAR